MDKRLTGILGEKLACKYYQDNGYEIKSVNYKTRFGEIDIVVSKKNLIVFSEVKTRKSNSMYSAKEAVTSSKQKKIKDSALIFIDEHNLTESDIRFDVVEVYNRDTNPKINVIENAFE